MISTRPRILIHIGYHKTGTTWLQNAFFPRHPELLVAGEYAELAKHVIYPDPLEYEDRAVRPFFQPRLDDAVSAGKLPVLTTERLSGNPHSGGYDSKLVADRLHGAFPEASIFIMVRRQAEMAVSMYKQYVRVGGICTLREYLMPPAEGRIPLFRLKFMEYQHLANYYRRLFGADRVRVMLYEHFRNEPAVFLDELCDFLGIRRGVDFPVQEKIHESRSDLATMLKCRVNRWHGADSLYPVTPPFPRVTESLFRAIERLDRAQWARNYRVGSLQREANELLRGRFGPSNRELASAFGLDLARYGYELE